MEEGLGPSIVEAVGELSQEESRAAWAHRLWWLWGLPFSFCYLEAYSERGRVRYQHTPVPPFSMRSLKVKILERGIICLVRWALALLFLVVVICCTGFLPESLPWVLSLGAVVVHHSRSVMSSVDRAQSGCLWAERVLAVCCYPCPCGLCQSHDDSKADMKSCGHSYSV